MVRLRAEREPPGVHETVEDEDESAEAKQRLMVMFLRARKPGESPLAGITTSRLVSFKVSLYAFG